MKIYLIVTNDELELPVSEEITGAEEAAKRLGIKKQRLRRCLCEGFPVAYKYKAIIVSERTIDDEKERRRAYNKKYAMTHDRTEYYRDRYLVRKANKMKEVIGSRTQN